MGQASTKSHRSATLDDDTLTQLSRAGEPLTLSAGEVLFLQGAAADAAYLVTKGRLEVSTRIPGDEVAAVSAIGPGEIVGEFALLDDRPRSTTVRAVEPTEGLRIPKLRFTNLLADGWAPGLAIIDGLCRLTASRIRASLSRTAAATCQEPSSLRRPGAAGEAQAVAGDDLAQSFAALPRAGVLIPYLGDLAAMGSWLLAPKGCRLADPGRHPAGLLLVLRGALRAAIPRPSGLEQLTIHGPGELVGAVALFDGEGEPLLIEAAEEALLLAIDRQRFEMLRISREPLGRALIGLVGRQMVRDQIRANRHLGRITALERFNAAGEVAHV